VAGPVVAALAAALLLALPGPAAAEPLGDAVPPSAPPGETATPPGAAPAPVPRVAGAGPVQAGPAPASPAVAAAKNMPPWAVLPYPVPRPAAPAAAPRPAAGPNRAGIEALAARPETPPRPRRRIPPSCSPDGAHCIAPVAFVRDACRTVEAAAGEAGLDPHFLARLIRQESLFDPYAISPAGALGIAQFMPGTARMRGLDDPFNPAAALQASAHYLAQLRDRFGNLGLAAVAYNGGEARAESFLARRGGLPAETRHYVRAITGLPAIAWRDSPPEAVDLTLDPDRPFVPACMALARGGRPPSEAPAPGWQMIYAAHPDRGIAQARGAAMRAEHAELLAGTPAALAPTRLPGRSRPYWVAAVTHEGETAARSHCARLRRAGGGCMVLAE